jgi:hypothetical protein
MELAYIMSDGGLAFSGAETSGCIIENVIYLCSWLVEPGLLSQYSD